ncbi:FAD-dependent monooxygenase [Tenggerimyces flavus]|uniref:FAD-dependent monooxygenase n=2 Tax=Tenggerimyces flavus TaxID=1708749 RepID=A0ABV7YHD9_9ACTN
MARCTQRAVALSLRFGHRAKDRTEGIAKDRTEGMSMRVVVVGAGPAGATLALLLARSGMDVQLLEREHSMGGVFRGEGLMPLGLDALHQMGLGHLIEEVPGRVVESWRIFIDGDETFTIPEPVDDLGALAFRVASPAALLERVVDEARRHATFGFHPATRFTDVVRNADGRVVGVRATTDDSAIELRADLVIGCDGRGSSVRTHAGLALTHDPAGYEVMWFKAPPPESLRRRCDFLLMIRAGRHPLVAYASWDDLLQCGLIMPKGGHADLRGDDWLPTAVSSAPGWLAEHVLAHRDEVSKPTRLNVLVGRAPSWSTPGVLLLGDAAHPMSPVRAQGINLALRDVIVAANHLIPLGDAPLDRVALDAGLDAACRAIQAEREPEVIRTQKLQRREAQGQGDARSATWRFSFAKRAAGYLGRYGWAQRAWLQRQHELRFGSSTVKLTVG